MKCRFCSSPVTQTVVDLGMQPLSNAYVDPATADDMERFYPLHAFVCGECFLVQIAAVQSPAVIFADYAYLSSMSDSWLRHCELHARTSARRFGLTGSSLVVEVASNDGYLLKFFRTADIPVLGIEPAANVAKIAQDAGIPTVSRFFGTALAKELVERGSRADLLVCNNVVAHVPDLNDFVAGLAIVLAPGGVLSIEVPHLAHVIDKGQFDTIYHEHFSYFSLLCIRRVLESHGLTVFDVEELSTHGGSLRVFARHAGNSALPIEATVAALIARERTAGLDSLTTYATFSERARALKRDLLEFLIACKRAGQSVAAYGAAAKGNTLLNYCGIRSDFIDFVVDRSPLKQGRLLPGSRIPIHAPEKIADARPDVILILPWNLKDEVAEQLSYTKKWGARLVVPIPAVTTLP